jgi:hypothetical protein
LRWRLKGFSGVRASFFRPSIKKEKKRCAPGQNNGTFREAIKIFFFNTSFFLFYKGGSL